MPHKPDKLKLRIPPEQDRRRKLSDEQKDDIRGLHKLGWSQRQLAKHYAVSRRLIQFIVDPEAEKRAKEAFRERQKDGRYHDPKRHTEAVRSTRRHRQELFKQGLLVEPEETL